MSITSADHAFAGLSLIARVTVADSAYVVYSDGAYTTALDETSWEMVDTDVYGPDNYSEWCAGSGSGVGDTDLCRRIARAAGLDGITSAGSCIWCAA